jgi:hypothetical protein
VRPKNDIPTITVGGRSGAAAAATAVLAQFFHIIEAATPYGARNDAINDLKDGWHLAPSPGPAALLDAVGSGRDPASFIQGEGAAVLRLKLRLLTANIHAYVDATQQREIQRGSLAAQQQQLALMARLAEQQQQMARLGAPQAGGGRAANTTGYAAQRPTQRNDRHNDLPPELFSWCKGTIHGPHKRAACILHLKSLVNGGGECSLLHLPSLRVGGQAARGAAAPAGQRLGGACAQPRRQRVEHAPQARARRVQAPHPPTPSIAWPAGSTRAAPGERLSSHPPFVPVSTPPEAPKQTRHQ